MPFVTLCLYEAVFRFSIDNTEYSNISVFSNSLQLLIKLLTVTSIICIIGAWGSGNMYPLLFLLMILPYSLRQLFAQFSRGVGYSKEFAFSGVINAFSLGSLNILFVGVLKYGVFGYILSIAIGNSISALYLFFRLKLFKYINFGNRDTQLIRLMLKYSLPMIPNSVSWWFANISTRYILMFFEGLSIAGIFTAISKLPSIINMLSSIFQQSWQFSASKEIKKKKSNEFFSNVFSIYYILIILSCSYLITVIPYVAKIVLQGEFFSYWIYVPFLLVSAVLNCFSVYFGSIYTAAMNNKMIMISTITGALVSVSSSFLLIPSMGIMGAIISSNLSYIVINLMRYFDTKRIIKLEINFKLLIFLLVSIYLQSFGYIVFKGDFVFISLFISLLISAVSLINRRNTKIKLGNK